MALTWLAPKCASRSTGENRGRAFPQRVRGSRRPGERRATTTREPLRWAPGGSNFEVIDPDTGTGADEGELVITNLGRVGSPVLRYRTGDRVRLHGHGCGCGRTFRRLEGGVIGRMDDVLIVRGVNVYPSAIENVVRACDGAGEFAVDVFRRGTMDDLEIRVEAQPSQADSVCGHVSRTLRDALALRAKVEAVSPGSLPRFELKAHRVHDHREDEAV